jgi:hypothetical protein
MHLAASHCIELNVVGHSKRNKVIEKIMATPEGVEPPTLRSEV